MVEHTNQQNKGTCKVCNDSFDATGHSNRERLLSVGVCPACDFMMSLWEIRNNPDVVRVNGEHYMIRQSHEGVKGFGGHKIVIQFNDGRVVETNNLWHQGVIPAEWRLTYLYDNAVFLEKAPKVTKIKVKEVA